MNSKYVIYLIYNKITGDRYIGATSNLNQRLRSHWSDLGKNKHGNINLQLAYNQYGKESFDVNIIQSVKHKTALLSEEQKWIECCNPEYNITSPDKPFSDKAYSKDARIKYRKNISKSLVSHYKTPKGKKRIKKHSKRMKDLWASGKFNPNLTHEDRVRIGKLGSIAQQATGYRHSDKTKKKISEATKRTYIGAVSPSGIIYAPIVGMQDFCNEHDLNLSSMIAVMHGRRNHHKGWTRYAPKTT